jgi:hypothetical protein
LKQLLKVLCDIVVVAGYTQASVGDRDQWSSIVNTAENNSQNYFKALCGKTMYSTLHDTYTVALQESRALLKANTSADPTLTPTPTPKPASNQEDGFTEVWMWKRQNSEKAAQISKSQQQQQCLPSQTPPPKTPQEISSPH